MSGRKATLLVRYRDDDGTWQRAAVAIAGNGRIRQGYALIGGTQVQVAEYNYPDLQGASSDLHSCWAANV
jgi:hypothetical protein